jgi:glycosyltransferase involved in cell wall biosynthesis
LLIADDPAAFAETVVSVLNDAELRRHLAHNARALVEAQYNWKGIGAQFVALVERAIRRHTHSR